MELNFKVISEAGLTQTEFADLLHAQRVTVNNWVNNRSRPHKMWGKKCATYLTLLKMAVYDGTLPGDIPPVHKDNMSERSDFIQTALREVAAEAKIQQAARKHESAQL